MAASSSCKDFSTKLFKDMFRLLAAMATLWWSEGESLRLNFPE